MWQIKIAKHLAEQKKGQPGITRTGPLNGMGVVFPGSRIVSCPCTGFSPRYFRHTSKTDCPLNRASTPPPTTRI